MVLLRQAHRRFKYGLDTLLACFVLLDKIAFKIEERKERLLVSALVSICGKVHEYRTPQYGELAIWG